jgi:hypothetical protein
MVFKPNIDQTQIILLNSDEGCPYYQISSYIRTMHVSIFAE